MRGRATLLLVALAGCSTIETPGLGPVTRVCEGADCRDVATAALRAERPVEPAAPSLEEARAAHAGGVRLRARDPAAAARAFEVAAAAGIPEAQYNLGLMQLRGEGGPRHLFSGLQWLRAAAAGGHLPAQVAVGRIYMTGLDTMGQDLAEARSWLATAAGRGDARARRWLAELDRAEAQEREAAARLRERAGETAAILAAAVLAAALAPPPVVVYGYR